MEWGGEDGCSGEGEGRDRWSLEGEDEEHVWKWVKVMALC